jgi:CheY-specific phosphatase CheX
VGKITGAVSIHMSSDFARIMTADMVGIEPDEGQGEEDISDVIGEFSNMVGGDLKSRFCDSGFPCVLSIPSITIGSNFRIQVRDWALHEKFLFRHQDHAVLVEVCVKTNV